MPDPGEPHEEDERALAKEIQNHFDTRGAAPDDDDELNTRYETVQGIVQLNHYLEKSVTRDRQLPIKPGSKLDWAIEAVVVHEISGAPIPDVSALFLVDPLNSAHMLALGTRIYVRRSGVDDPAQLIASLHDQWYGKPNPDSVS